MDVIYFWPLGKDASALFEKLFGPHLKSIYRLAYRVTGQREDAEDLVQDLLLKLYPHLEEIQKIDRLAPWLVRILYRLFIDKKRRQKRSSLYLKKDDRVICDNCACSLTAPPEVANAMLILEAINTALQKLSEDHRMTILLHDVEGYSFQEINQITGIAVGTIKSRHSRARKQLREIIYCREL